MSRLTSKLPSQIVLLIGDEGALAVPYGLPGEDAPVFAPEKNERAIDDVFALFARNPHVPVTLFADNLAQDFRLESIPRLSLFDRPKLIERRLRQAFPQAGLAASSVCPHDRGEVLFAALHEGGPVFEWIERFRKYCPERAPRIALLPVECADIVPELIPEAAEGWGLVLSRQRTGGFRQIVTHKGELVFARLTPPLPAGAPADEIAETVARDIKASLGYLARLGLTDVSELHTALLMPQAAHAALRAAVLPMQDVRLFTPYQAVWDLGVAADMEPDDPHSDRLYAGWLAQKRKLRMKLAPPDLAQTHRTAVIRQWGWRAAAAALFVAFVATGWQAGDLFTTLAAVRVEATQLADIRWKLAQEQADAASITEPLGRLRQAVERRRIFSEPAPVPWAALERLDSGLGDARVVKLDWRSDTRKPDDEIMQVELKFTGAPPKSNMERQELVSRFQTLAQQVAQAMPGYDVRLTRYPFPVLPDEALSNEDAAKPPASDDTTADIVISKAAP